MSSLTQIHVGRKLQQLPEDSEAFDLQDALAMEASGLDIKAQVSLPVATPVSGLLTTNTVEHRIQVVKLGPLGVVCVGVPGVLPTGEMGLRLDDACENQSYLFRVSVSWIEHVSAEHECKVGFDFVGLPVIIRWSRGRSRTPNAVLALESTLSAA